MLLLQATSLSCTHSFCAFCLEEWMKRKKNCPVCRTPVTSMARAIVLDSYIEKMVSCFSEEMKERREQIIKERKGNYLTSFFFSTLIFLKKLFSCHSVKCVNIRKIVTCSLLVNLRSIPF